ncbi:GIY-YIG nuclease family protein [Aliarcobacter butzleri]
MNKQTLDDIFNDDDFGLLDTKKKSSNVKTEEDRLIEAFEEINIFIDKNQREPNTSSMSEYGLYAKLKNFKDNEIDKKILKPYDRHNLLSHVEMNEITIDDILNDDELGLLKTGDELDIFKYKHIPKGNDRAKTDFVAKRKSMSENEFKKYETIFQQIHLDIKNGKRKLLSFNKYEENLKIGSFYLINGVLAYLESADLEKSEWVQKSGNRIRTDGRTKTIFENKTYSNMLFRSLGKQIEKDGKMVSDLNDKEQTLFTNSNTLKEEDVHTGWIYVLKSKSTNPDISNIENLYKIGFSSTSVDERIKNAKNEATYLFADVKKIATYKVYNRNADKLESLIHKFFGQTCCLNVDLFNKKGQRITPREWFIVPFEVIEEAIELILNENIINYEYDLINKKLILKNKFI